MDEDCLPLGAQHNNNDKEEDDHFQQVVASYQQYATFHQTRQQGVNRRMHQLLLPHSSPPDKASASEAGHRPTIESILPPSLLPKTLENQRHQKQFCDATIRNQFFLDNVLKYSGVPTSQEILRQRRQQQCSSNNEHVGGGGWSKRRMEWATEDQMSKIDSVLKSVARDWSSEGREERSVVYDRIVGALEKHLPLNGDHGIDETSTNEADNQRFPPRVAVPGSGLGRLAWEIYSRGYSVQGSDFSLPMLLASDFMLNGCGSSEEEEVVGGSFKRFQVSPWISETKNTASFQHRIRTVVVPDVDPTALQHNQNDGDEEGDDEFSAPEFTMMAGEFLSLYSHFLPDHQHSHSDDNNLHQHSNSTKKFHAIACSFFLDTAPSLPHYLLAIYHMLEDGGLLLNFGPLMYHWSGHGGLLPGDVDSTSQTNNGDNGDDSISTTTYYQKRNKHLDSRYLSSIDYTWDEVRYMILQCGFEIEEEEMNIPARYTSDAQGMMKVVYDCVFLVARKKGAK